MGKVKGENTSLINLAEDRVVIQIRDRLAEGNICTCDRIEVDWSDIAVRTLEQLLFKVVEGSFLFKPDVELIDQVETHIV